MAGIFILVGAIGLAVAYPPIIFLYMIVLGMTYWK
jgi:hypothetical protein